jgi:hypothetical protein
MTPTHNPHHTGRKRSLQQITGGGGDGSGGEHEEGATAASSLLPDAGSSSSLLIPRESDVGFGMEPLQLQQQQLGGEGEEEAGAMDEGEGAWWWFVVFESHRTAVLLLSACEHVLWAGWVAMSIFLYLLKGGHETHTHTVDRLNTFAPQPIHTHTQTPPPTTTAT